MKKNFFLLSVLFVAVTMFPACSDDDPETPEIPALSLSPTTGTISFSSNAVESYTYEVKTNQQSWTAEPDLNWCVVTPDYENNTFTVTAQENDLETPLPDATVTVKAGAADPVTVKASMGAAAYSVYAVGSIWDGYRQTLCFWKDGVRTDFEHGPNYYPDIATVSGGSYYLFGGYNEGSDYKYCYWKDGVRNDLDFLSDSDYVKAMAVSGGSVYLAGEYNNGYNNKPCYWKDGIKTDLDFPINAWFEITSITVSDGSVYIGGCYINQEFGKVACYWKDGAWTDFKYTRMGYDLVLIAVEKGSLYLAYSYYDEDSDYIIPCWWKDGVMTACQQPEEGNTSSFTNSLAVDHGTVHIIGSSTYGLTYWKDGVPTVVGDNENRYSEISFAAAGGSVYFVGVHYDATTRIYKACYWKDGLKINLDTPEGDLSTASYILVEKR